MPIFKPLDREYKNFFLISIFGIIFVGFSWEIFELLIGVISVDSPQYGYDTFLDLSFGILGAIVACIYTYNKERMINKG